MLAEVFLLGAIFFHLWLCPFTKVEESFNMQAMHDILYRGVVDISQYDHHQFPGVVPRTFIGPLLISGLSYPFLHVARVTRLPDTLGIAEKLMCQYLVRGMLGVFVFYTFLRFRGAISKIFGYSVARWFLLITATQFHLVFYSSRSLPNTFALAFTLLSMAYFMERQLHKFVITATFVMVVFRGELALLFGPFVIMELLQRRLSFSELLKYGLLASIFSLALTVGVDSYFWQRRLWPEGEVLWFNTILNKSSNWGTSPFLWYFYSAIPRALMTSVAFIPVGAYLDLKARRLVTYALIFVVLFSNLPHKELRFIFYALPLFNLTAAVGCDRLIKNRHKGFLWFLLSAACLWQILINMMGTSAFLYISHDNYPGAKALAFMHQIEPPEVDIRVHIDAYAAQTGITQFLQHNDKWMYDKSETLLPTSRRMVNSMQYAIARVGDNQQAEEARWGNTHVIVGEISSFHGITFDIKKAPPFEIHKKTKIIIFQNKKYLQTKLGSEYSFNM